MLISLMASKLVLLNFLSICRSDGDFIEVDDVSGLDNQTLFNKLVKIVTDGGSEVLIQDASYCDYPSYHVVILGLSEIYDTNDEWLVLRNDKLKCRNLLCNPEKITSENTPFYLEPV